MLDYVLNLELFEAGAENVLACQTYSLIADYADIERPNLLRLFKFIELVDSLRDYNDAQKEQVISYILDRYRIAESTNSPFDDDSLGGILSPVFSGGGTSGPVYWEDVLGKPVSDLGTNANNLEQFIIDTVPPVDVKLTQSILVSQGISGLGVSPGDTLEMGMTFTEALRRMLNKTLYPTYDAPSGTLVSTTNGYVEVGTNVNLALTGSFTQRDAGPLTKFEVTKNGISVYIDDTLPINHTYGDNFTISEGSTSYLGKYYYGQGILKNTTPAPGEPYPTGRIAAGSVNTNTAVVTAIIPWFYGSSSSNATPTITSGTKVIAPSNGSITVPSFGSGDLYLWFAVPRTTGGVSQKAFTTWYRSVFDSGSIGGDNMFGSPIVVSVSSSGLPANWTRDFDLYMTTSPRVASTATTFN